MEQGEYLYAIGLGDAEDWKAGRGGFYYVEDGKGDHALPVFTTRERAAGYATNNLRGPNAHLSMLESAGAVGVEALTKGRFVLMLLSPEGAVKAALALGASYLIRDPRPGGNQEILRLQK